MAAAPTVPVLEAEGPPLDYSYKELRSCAELITEQPRNARKASPRERPEKDDKGVIDERSKVERKLAVTLLTSSLRLNNNVLTSLKDLPAALTEILPNPARLLFLDLSWNSLQTIDSCLLQYEQLKALYLHGNRIAKLPQADKLAKVAKLRSLTLNGNPIECNSCYRLYVIGVLQHSTDIRSLDHSTVTDDERERAEAWFIGHQARIGERQKKMEEAAYAAGMA
jgi:hypothetical protein